MSTRSLISGNVTRTLQDAHSRLQAVQLAHAAEQEWDVVLLYSGGADSTNLLSLYMSGGLRVLAVHLFDGSWRQRAAALAVAKYYQQQLWWHRTSKISQGRLQYLCLDIHDKRDIFMRNDGYIAGWKAMLWLHMLQVADYVGCRRVATGDAGRGLGVPFDPMADQIAALTGTVKEAQIGESTRTACAEFTAAYSWLYGREGLEDWVCDEPLASFSKAEATRLGVIHRAPHHLSCSCTNRNPNPNGTDAAHCGTCWSCLERQAAYILLGGWVRDPSTYDTPVKPPHEWPAQYQRVFQHYGVL